MFEIIINIIIQYLIPFFTLPLLGTVLGSWLSQFYFPFARKRKEWRWEKEMRAKENFCENVGRVSFLAKNYLRQEYESRFSMSAFDMERTNAEIIKIIRSLHVNAGSMYVYLSRSDGDLFRKYLEGSQCGFDHASETWGQWIDDEMGSEIIKHTENTIFAQGLIAEKTIRQLKGLS